MSMNSDYPDYVYLLGYYSDPYALALTSISFGSALNNDVTENYKYKFTDVSSMSGYPGGKIDVFNYESNGKQYD